MERADCRRGAIDVDELAAALRRLTDGADRVIVGLTGPPGCGKSTLVETLLVRLRPLEVGHVPMDGFHLADAVLDHLGLTDRKGAPETFDVDGYAALLHRLRTRRGAERGTGAGTGAGTVYAPGFERTLEQPIAARIAVPPQTRLVLTEGNYLLLEDPRWRRVRTELDEVWYVDAPHAQRRTRLLERHQRFGKSAAEARDWVARVDDANARLVAGTRGGADRVVEVDSGARG